MEETQQKRYLNPETKKLLSDSGLLFEIIEFLDRHNKMADACNGSRNPKAAAITMMGREKNKKMFQAFLNRTLANAAKVPDDVEKMVTLFRRKAKTLSAGGDNE